MSWLARALIGPTLWAVAFTAVYALHGLGCARGWPLVALGPVSLHQGVLWGGYALGLLATGAALLWVPREAGMTGQIVQAAGWIGFVATAFTLAPVVALTSC